MATRKHTTPVEAQLAPSLWQRLAAASDSIAEHVKDIPAAMTPMPGSSTELARALALLTEAEQLLESTAEREGARYAESREACEGTLQ